MRARFGVVAVLAVLLGIPSLSGCAARRVVPVDLPADALVPAVDARNLVTHESAVRGIAAIMEHDLHLPLPKEVTVFVYGSRGSFERGLIEDGQVAPARAAELSDFAVGVGKRRQLLLYDARTVRPGRAWLRLIAHELAHVSQIELAQHEGRAEQWLAEGMAEWVAFRVLERLGLDTVTKRRAAAAAGVRGYTGLTVARLDLDMLGTPRGFTVRSRREGSLRTYQLAFLMADYLIRRDGLERVIGYFRSFARDAGREEAFETAFGQSLDAFEAEVRGYLRALASAS